MRTLRILLAFDLYTFLREGPLSSGVQQTAMETAYTFVKSRILNTTFGEGEFLTEGHVAEELGLSRTPVREAFHRLEHEGLLKLAPKKGAFVPAITRREVEEVMEARRLIERHSAMRAVLLGDELPDLHRELQSFLREQAAYAEEGDTEAFVDCDRRFHARLVGASGNSIMREIYDGLRDRQLRMGVRAVVATSQRAKQVLREHEAIVDGLASGDPEVAREALDAHLDATLAALHEGR